MPKPRGFIEPKILEIADFFGGLNTSSPPDRIADNEFQEVLNLQYYQGVLQVDTGFYQLGQSGLQGNPLQPIQFQISSGVFELCLVTTTGFYVYNSTSKQWILSMTAVATTTIAAAVSGSPWDPSFSTAFGPLGFSQATSTIANITVTNATGIVVGQLLQVLQSNGNYYQATVTSVVGNVVGVSVAPTVTIAAGTTIQFFTPFQGGLYKISWCVDATTNTLIWTNGVDPVQGYVGGITAPLGGLTGLVATARFVTRYFGYTLLFGTTEGGSYLSYRVRWSTPVSSTDWTDPAAGFQDLDDTSDPIEGIGIVSGYLVIYRQETVIIGTYWGVSYATFYFQYTLRGTGILGSGGGVCDTRDAEVFISPSGIFRYIGDYSPQDIGMKIYDYLLGPGGFLDPRYTNSLFFLYVPQLDEVWLFFAFTGNTQPINVFRYSSRYKGWFLRKFPLNIAGASLINNSNGGLTWAQTTIPWDKDNAAWQSAASQNTYPLICLAGYSSNAVYVYDYKQQTDNGTTIAWHFTTKDFPSMQERLTFDGINLYVVGTGSVEVSVNGGQSFLTVGTFSSPNGLSWQKLDLQVTGNYFRFRFSGTDPNFQLTEMALRYIDASEF